MEKTLLVSAKREARNGKPYTIEFWGGEVAEVAILDRPMYPLETLARVTRGYLGNYTMDDISADEMKTFAAEIQKTPLATPIEFLNFVFLLRDVPRSFTHQLVRTRIGAAYVQESTRFMGHRGLYKILVPESATDKTTVKKDYFDTIINSIDGYENLLLDPTVHSQDARQLLPQAMLTHVFWSINMKALRVVYNQRWCCCAEPSSWLPVLRQVKKLITESCGTIIGGMLTAPIDRGESCGFNSKVLDQPCKWRK